jgi:hypothetical protein
MIPLMHTKKFYISAAIATILILVGILALLSSAQNAQDQQWVQNNDMPTRMTIADIEAINVHSGLEIECPGLDEEGIYGYVYTVTLTGKRGIIERIGCGVGTPEIYAQAIAEDLYDQELFGTLNPEEVLEKLAFKFYDLNTEN